MPAGVIAPRARTTSSSMVCGCADARARAMLVAPEAIEGTAGANFTGRGSGVATLGSGGAAIATETGDNTAV